MVSHKSGLLLCFLHLYKIPFITCATLVMRININNITINRLTCRESTEHVENLRNV